VDDGVAAGQPEAAQAGAGTVPGERGGADGGRSTDGARPCLRGLWLARCDAIVRLAARLDGQGTTPLPVLRTWLRNAWEAILLERVTDTPQP
jgi:hypothetical protein